MTTSTSAPGGGFADEARAIDEVCDRFEDAWKRGDAPRLADYLGDAQGERRADLFRELLHLDLFYQARSGRSASEDYASRFPDLLHVLTEVLEASPSELTTDGVPRSANLSDFESPPTGAHPARHQGSSPKAGGVPGYEVQGMLGRGGMGVVYLARQTGAGRLVALKMMRAGAGADEQERARFSAEAHAMARLRHPGIVQVYEVGEHDGQPFFSMEYCEDGSLDAKLGGTPLQGRDAAGLVARLADAVHEAHRAGIIHRDLKPGNVLVQRKPPLAGSPAMSGSGGGSGSAAPAFRADDFDLKVTDFGLAKRLDDVGMTATGAVMGTPSYMAPEQAAGTKGIGPAADVWALGAILYECLVGRPPFRAATAFDTILQVLTDDPVPPRRLAPRIDLDLETVALKCLAKAPAQRYASAAELAADLRRFLGGIPTRARPVGRLESFRRWAVRRPSQAGMLAVSVLAALALLAGAIYASWAIGTSRSDAALAKLAADSQRLAAETERFHSLLRQARERAATPVPGWSVAALAELKEAASLSHVASQNAAALNSDLANCLLSLDVQPLGSLDVPLAHCSAWRPGRNEVAIGQRNQVGFGLVKIWLMHADSGKQVRELTFVPSFKFRLGDVPKLDGVEAVAFSPDGRRLAAAARNGGIWLWDLDKTAPEGKHLLTLPHGWQTVGFDADGAALVCHDARTLVSWSVAEGKEMARRSVPSGEYGPPSIDPRGGQLAVSINNRIEFLCTRRLTPVAQPILHRGNPTFCPDGRMLAVRAGSVVQLFAADGQVKEPISTLRQPNGESTDDDNISGVAFSPDGSQLLTVSEYSRHARLWEVASGRLLMPMVLPGEITGTSFAPDGKRLLVQADSRSLWFGITGGEWQSLVASGPSLVDALAYAPNGTLAVQSMSTDHSHASALSLWSPRQPPALRARVAQGGAGAPSLPVIAFSPSNDLTFLNGSRNRLVLWEGVMPAVGRRIALPREAEGMAYAPDGRLWCFEGPVVSVVTQDGIRWTNSLLAEKRSATSLVASAAHLVTGWRDGTIRVHGREAQPTRSRRVASSRVQALALAPGASQVAAGTEAGEVILLAVPDLSQKARSSEADGHRDAVSGLAFLASGLVVSAGLDGRLSLWVRANDRLRLALRLKLPRAVRAMAAHPDRQRVAVLLDRERAVRVLDLSGLLGHLAGFGADRDTLKLPPRTPMPKPPIMPPRPPFAGVDPPTGPNGLRAELFADPWFDHRVKVRHDTRFAFDWGEKTPDRAVPGPGFSVRWTGWLVPPKPGRYKLWGRGDGKSWVRPWAGNSPFDYFDDTSHAEVEFTYDGKPLPIRIDFTTKSPTASFVLGCSQDGNARKEAIPPEWLFHTESEAMKAAGANKD